jgi:3-hydroxybutyryl-CoA dehydrogenase
MPPLGAGSTVGVLGAGAMGGGIAQVAAAAGHRVVLVDTAPRRWSGRARPRRRRSGATWRRGARPTADARATLDRLELAGLAGPGGMDAFRDCDLVIEAIVERLDVKRDSFARWRGPVRPEVRARRRTPSSLVGVGDRRGVRAPGARGRRALLQPGARDAARRDRAGRGARRPRWSRRRARCGRWGKTTVDASDTPGFIVNRVARPFYGEALPAARRGARDAATIDWAMREVGGFRMGPFELMDFIGHDVNFAVTRSVYEAFFHDRATARRSRSSGCRGRAARAEDGARVLRLRRRCREARADRGPRARRGDRRADRLHARQRGRGRGLPCASPRPPTSISR